MKNYGNLRVLQAVVSKVFIAEMLKYKAQRTFPTNVSPCSIFLFYDQPRLRCSRNCCL